MIQNFIRKYYTEILTIFSAVVVLTEVVIFSYLYKETTHDGWYVLSSKLVNKSPNIIIALLWPVVYVLGGMGLQELWSRPSSSSFALVYTTYLVLSKVIYIASNGAFNEIWSFSHIMLGMALMQLWSIRSTNKMALIFLGINAVCSIIWKSLFLHRPDLALMNMYLVIISLIIAMYLARNQQSVVIILLPYVAAVIFLTLVNFKVCNLNMMS